MNSPLDRVMAVVTEKNSAARKTSESLEKAKLRHNQAVHRTESAIKAYNLERIELIVAALSSEGLGLCEHGSFECHLAPVAGIVGVVSSGSYTRGSEYYERDDHYVSVKMYCREHSKLLKLRKGHDTTMPIDAVARTKDLVTANGGAHDFEDKEITKFATAHGIPARIIAKNGPFARGYTLDGVDLEIIGR